MGLLKQRRKTSSFEEKSNSNYLLGIIGSCKIEAQEYQQWLMIYAEHTNATHLVEVRSQS